VIREYITSVLKAHPSDSSWHDEEDVDDEKEDGAL
jgi:hypothetical protein